MSKPAKIVRLDEGAAKLIDRAFLPRNPNKLRGPLDQREALKDAVHEFRLALAVACEPNSDATFQLATCKAALAMIEAPAGGANAHPRERAELAGALRMIITSLES